MTLSDHERHVLAEIEWELSRSRRPVVECWTRICAFSIRYWRVELQLAALVCVVVAVVVLTGAAVAVPTAIAGGLGGYLLCGARRPTVRHR
jgi:hypothetical protein